MLAAHNRQRQTFAHNPNPRPACHQDVGHYGSEKPVQESHGRFTRPVSELTMAHRPSALAMTASAFATIASHSSVVLGSVSASKLARPTNSLSDSSSPECLT